MLIESLYYLLHNSLVDHHKYVSNKRSYHKICRISNRICQENGLATSMPTKKKEKAIKRTWNIIVAPVGKPHNYIRIVSRFYIWSATAIITRWFF